MNERQEAIANIRQRLGWAYSEMKWLTKGGARRANRKREKLLCFLNGRINYCFERNKIHMGALSPGCSVCGQGFWSCMFINGKCSAHCFYCPQKWKMKKERPPNTAGVTFNHPEEYADYLERLGFKGVGFSGGEPLLVFGKLLDYIRVLRRRLGDRLYLWIYTNGDLADKKKLIGLKKAGLNEIRFDISTRGYDLSRVALAIPIIDTVTVEIPAIPEDYRIVTTCLAKMCKLGVQHLNLHQLQTTQNNYRNFIHRNYTFLHSPLIPIFESEITALKLMKFALNHRINLPINYCSAAYKNRLQAKGLRERLASVVKNDHEELTQTGHIRRLSIQASSENIRKIVAMLKQNKCPEALFSLNDAGTEIFFHTSRLKGLDLEGFDSTPSYFEPQLSRTGYSSETAEKMMLDSRNGIFIKKQLITQYKGLSALGMKSFQKLFFENAAEGKVIKHFLKSYELKTKEDFDLMIKEADFLKACKQFERLEAGFPELY
ncbi:MAG: radical SAM protein [Candidatus Omnitrophota bacterium]|jgi:pyruvate formate-lyase activating enzyme-like uncharacterized protein